MVYKLVVTLFLMTNGVPAEEPSGSIPNRTEFQTEEACKGYFDTEAGKKAKEYLEAVVGRSGEKFDMRVSCVPAESKGEKI